MVAGEFVGAELSIVVTRWTENGGRVWVCFMYTRTRVGACVRVHRERENGEESKRDRLCSEPGRV